MAISEEKTRVTITLGNALLEKIDEYCANTSQTRSGYITSVVGRDLYAQSQTMGQLSALMQQMFGQFSAEFGENCEQKRLEDATQEELQQALWGEAYGQRPAGL